MKRLVLLAGLLGALLAATPAHAAHGMQVGIADDRTLLAGGLVADEAVAEWHRLGIDSVRIFAQWSRIAPAARSIHAPSGFEAADDTAHGYHWTALDDAVSRVQRAGMRVILTITGPGPIWGSSAPSRHNQRYAPRPSAYAAFAQAVARRYGATVTDFILYNEPNLPAWLQPQSTCRHHRCTPRAPHVYRSLVRAAYPAIKAVDPGARVLIGALAPRGSDETATNSSLRPLVFIRALACANTKYSRARTGACKHFHSALADGFAYHPHNVVNPPLTPFPERDDLDLASLPRLEHVLDLLQSRRLLRASTPRFGLYLDEFGYQTDPPDPILGVSLHQQDRWTQQAFYRVWRDPRVKLMVQYGWRDEPVSKNGSYSGWQAGLRFANLRPKPLLSHFAAIVAAAHGKRSWPAAARSGR